MKEETEIGSEKFLRVSNPLAWGTIITAAFLSFIIWLGFIDYCNTSPDGTQKCISKFERFWRSPPNEIGDALAGIAGALAFLWIIITVMIQSQELKAQRAELKAQHTELKLSREVAIKSNENMASQRFENTLFSLLTTYNEIVASIDLYKQGAGSGINRRDSTLTTGRDCFTVFYRRLGSKFKKFKDSEDALETAYTTFWNETQAELGHYFRFLYRAFLIIDEHPYAEPHHSKILRSLLSDQELLLIYYNCLSEQGSKFQKLAVKFELFDNLPADILLQDDHLSLMPKKALGNNAALSLSEITS